MGQARGVLWKCHIFCCLIAVRSWEVTDHSLLLFRDDGWTAPLALWPVQDSSMFGKSILRCLRGENPARLSWACLRNDLCEVYSSPRLEQTFRGARKCTSLAIGPGGCYIPPPRSLEDQQQEVFGIHILADLCSASSSPPSSEAFSVAGWWVCLSMLPRSAWCKSFPARASCRSHRIPFASPCAPRNLLPFRSRTRTTSFKPSAFLSASTFSWLCLTDDLSALLQCQCSLAY